MYTYTIPSGQLDKTDLDAPSSDIILEALQDVQNELNPEGVWTHKGNYRLDFWTSEGTPSLVFCNAFVLVNPDNELDSATMDYCYYIEITRSLNNE